MDINININAPGLTEALNNLAKALYSGASNQVGATAPQVTNNTPAPSQQAVYQAPVQPQYQVPTNIAPPVQVQQPQAQVQAIQPAPVSIVPTTPQAYTMEQLAVAATQIVDTGRRNDLISLLGSFGVQALTALPKEQYGQFATQLRALGAKI